MQGNVLVYQPRVQQHGYFFEEAQEFPLHAERYSFDFRIVEFEELEDSYKLVVFT